MWCVNVRWVGVNVILACWQAWLFCARVVWVDVAMHRDKLVSITRIWGVACSWIQNLRRDSINVHHSAILHNRWKNSKLSKISNSHYIQSVVCAWHLFLDVITFLWAIDNVWSLVIIISFTKYLMTLKIFFTTVKSVIFTPIIFAWRFFSRQFNSRFKSQALHVFIKFNIIKGLVE